MPTRIVDNEFHAATDVELFDDRSVAAAILFIVCDGASDTVLLVFIVGCGVANAGTIRSVVRLVFRDAIFAPTDRRSEIQGRAEERQERLERVASNKFFASRAPGR